MRRSEMAQVMAEISVAYPKAFAAWGEAERDAAIRLWHEMFADVELGVMRLAVRKLMLESPYPPTIADVRERVAQIQQPETAMGADEAWGYVIRALRKYGNYRTKEALESMPENVRTLVKRIGWAEMCMSENIDVIRGQFCKLYVAMMERRRKDSLLPQGMRDMIAQAGIKTLESGGRDDAVYKSYLE